MKKIPLILLLLGICFHQKVIAQTYTPLPPGINTYQNICFIKYVYDNSGNRTQRLFECGPNPFYNLGTGNSGGGGNQRPAGIVATKNEGIIIFPNPTKGLFFVQLPESIENCLIEIRDMQGKLLKKYFIEQINQGIDISSYANGQYLINVITGDKNEIIKLSKSN